MAMSAIPYFLVMLTMGTGLAPLPVGLPPGPMDQRLAAAAPEDALIYISWAGTAEADKNSPNKTERLLAEPEVQHFCRQLEQAIVKAVQPRPDVAGEAEKLLGKELPFLVKTLLTHPASFHVSKLGRGEQGVVLEGALICNPKPDLQKVRDSLAAIEALARKEMQAGEVRDIDVGAARLRGLPMPKGAPNVYWGWVNGYVVIAAGDATAKRTIEQLNAANAQPPAWLTNVHKSLPVDRPSCVTYLSPKLGPAIGDMFGMGDQVHKYMTLLGLGNVTSIATVAGLDGDGYASRTLIGLDGAPAGLLAPFRGKGLLQEDVASIPSDANIAFAARLDAADLWREMLNVMGGIEPKMKQRFEREVAESEKEIGFSIATDLLAPFGDVWAVYNSPGDGGLVITGLTAVAKVKDPKRLAETHRKLLDLMNQEFKLHGEGRPRGVQLKEMKFADQTIYYLNPVGEEMPLSPSWCLTDKEVIFALYPQMVKAYLSRDKAPAAQGAGFPKAIADRVWKGGRAPVMLAYMDTPSLFRDLYPVLHPLMTMAFSELQRQGFEMNIADLPSARAIARHLGPGSSAVYRTEQGILIESHGTLPIGGAAALVPAMGSFMWYGFARADVPMPADRPAMIQPLPPEQVPAPVPPQP